jgi:hypothetical protein
LPRVEGAIVCADRSPWLGIRHFFASILCRIFLLRLRNKVAPRGATPLHVPLSAERPRNLRIATLCYRACRQSGDCASWRAFRSFHCRVRPSIIRAQIVATAIVDLKPHSGKSKTRRDEAPPLHRVGRAPRRQCRTQGRHEGGGYQNRTRWRRDGVRGRTPCASYRTRSR